LTNPPSQPGPDSEGFALKIDELKSNLIHAEPIQLANHTGTIFKAIGKNQGEFRFDFLGSQRRLNFPDLQMFDQLTGLQAASIEQALVLYYFNISDATPISGRWISFADLPDGRFYNQAFQGYTGKALVQVFQDDQARFEETAVKLGGGRSTLGTVSFIFQALPRVSLAVVFWLGDEEWVCNSG